MKRIDMGLYSYLITGDREDEAAEKMLSTLEFLERDYTRPASAIATDRAELPGEIEKRFGVTVRNSLDLVTDHE